MNLTDQLKQTGALYSMGQLATEFVAGNSDIMLEFRSWLRRNSDKVPHLTPENISELLGQKSPEEMSEDLKKASHNFGVLLDHVDELTDYTEALRDIL